ncbi:MAG: hypothetical protein ACI9U2_000706 [Bradymonadia bacterium]
MRLVLKQGTREILLFSRNRFVRFDSPRTAGDFLAGYLLQADNLVRLRAALQSTSEFSWLARRDDVTVLDRVSSLLSNGIVRLIADPDNLTPWAWRFDSPTFPQASAGSEFESSPLVQDDDEDPEQEHELEDPVPEPVLPPVFITVAAQEAESVLGENRLYKLALDMLRFFGLGGSDESEVAPAYSEVESAQSNAIDEVTGTFVASLEPLAAGGLEARPPSELAQIFPSVIQTQLKAIDETTENTSEGLESLLSGPFDGAPDSTVAPGLMTEATLTISAVAAHTQAAADTLTGLADPLMNMPPPPSVAESLRANAIAQADQIEPLTAPTAAALGAMSEGIGNLPPAGMLMQHLRISAEGSGQKVMEITAVASDSVAVAVTGPAAPAPDDGQVGAMFRFTSDIQAQAINNQIESMGGNMTMMAEVRPAPLLNSSLISDVYLGQADAQEASLVTSATLACDDLARLAAPPAER